MNLYLYFLSWGLLSCFFVLRASSLWDFSLGAFVFGVLFCGLLSLGLLSGIFFVFGSLSWTLLSLGLVFRKTLKWFDQPSGGGIKTIKIYTLKGPISHIYLDSNVDVHTLFP